MSYTGSTYRIPCLKGGWNANPNISLLPPESMISAVNINLHRGGRETRGGTTKINTAAITGTPQIMGLFQFRKKSGNSFTVTVTSNGKIYKDYTTELKTGLSVTGHVSFEVFNDTLYIFIKGNIPQKWDGVASSTSNLPNIPSDWTGSNYPAWVVLHGKGNSERLWAGGCATNPNVVYASANSSDDFSDVNVLTFNIETGDGFGIVGAVEYGDRLICFGKSKSFVIDDTDASTANWGYTASQWEGGVAHHWVLIRVPNDIVAMMENGDIYSVTAVQEYGDYKAASISRPVYINKWVDDNVDLTKIEQFHGIYDPALRAIKIFVIRAGQTQVDTALVYFIDRGPSDGWARHNNTAYTSGYTASCSALFRVSSGTYRIYTGDYAGFVRRLEDASYSDDGNYYYSGFTTPYVDFEDHRTTKRYDRGYLTIIPQVAETITVLTNIDNERLTSDYDLATELSDTLVTEDGYTLAATSEDAWQIIAEVGDTYLVTEYGQTMTTEDNDLMIHSNTINTNTLQDADFGMGLVGRRIQNEVYSQKVGDRFFISELLYDFKPLSKRISRG